MLGEDSLPSFFIYKARVGVDLRETLHYSQMLQNRLDEEKTRIAFYLQITPTYIIDNSIYFPSSQTEKSLLMNKKKIKMYTLKQPRSDSKIGFHGLVYNICSMDLINHFQYRAHFLGV